MSEKQQKGGGACIKLESYCNVLLISELLLDFIQNTVSGEQSGMDEEQRKNEYVDFSSQTCSCFLAEAQKAVC